MSGLRMGATPQIRTTASTKRGQTASVQLRGGTASIQILQGDSVIPEKQDDSVNKIRSVAVCLHLCQTLHTYRSFA